jgi:GntR family transcriptional regulator/MocR family aminotransferase
VGRKGVAFESVSEKLLSQNIRLHTLSRYYLGPEDRQGFVFGFGVSSLAEISAGLGTLKDILQADSRGR